MTALDLVFDVDHPAGLLAAAEDDEVDRVVDVEGGAGAMPAAADAEMEEVAPGDERVVEPGR